MVVMSVVVVVLMVVVVLSIVGGGGGVRAVGSVLRLLGQRLGRGQGFTCELGYQFSHGLVPSQ